MMPAPTWSDISANYAETTAPAIAGLMDWRDGPPPGGRLLLWHGVPGTGKTTALRALAWSWRSWAEFQFITDPEEFLRNPSYLLRTISNDRRSSLATSPVDRWRVLVLEDAGEYLAPDAKHATGQALSRLLNVCDGVLGQATRSLVIVTTNEPLRALHPALARPGRCLSEIEFAELGRDEIRAWCRGCGTTPPEVSRAPLAELYAHSEGAPLPLGRRAASGSATRQRRKASPAVGDPTLRWSKPAALASGQGLAYLRLMGKQWSFDVLVSAPRTAGARVHLPPRVQLAFWLRVLERTCRKARYEFDLHVVMPDDWDVVDYRGWHDAERRLTLVTDGNGRTDAPPSATPLGHAMAEAFEHWAGRIELPLSERARLGCEMHYLAPIPADADWETQAEYRKRYGFQMADELSHVILNPEWEVEWEEQERRGDDCGYYSGTPSAADVGYVGSVSWARTPEADPREGYDPDQGREIGAVERGTRRMR